MTQKIHGGLHRLLGLIIVMMSFLGFGSAQTSIGNCQALADINSNLWGNYILTGNLDCTASGNSIMIWSEVAPFEWIFDGGEHTITIDIDSTEEYIGLFRHTNAANISDLTVSGSVISTFDPPMFGDGEVWVLAGLASATTFDNVHSMWTVIGLYRNIWGLIWHTVNSSIIKNSSSSATINATGANEVWGLIGRSDNTTISGSYALGDVRGGLRVGGLVGIGDGNTVTQSYARGNVDADYAAGGLFGRTFTTNITDSYAHGYVHVRDGEAAGLIGFVDSTTITNSYAIGNVTGSTYDFGGLVANSQWGSNIESNSFWDRESSEMTNSLFWASMSTAEMKDSSTFTGAGWDFDTIWGISGALNHGYPYLLAIPPLPDDTTTPDTFITFAGGDAVDSSGATFEFLANEDSTFECSIDDGVTIEDFAPCVSPYTRNGFLQGQHIFYVRAVDTADNADPTPASRTWTIADSEEILSVTPTDGAINVATDATIVVTFAQPVLLSITVSTGPCDGSWSMCPQLDGVWSSGNTVLTYTRTDEDFHNNTSYSIQISENNGIVWHQLYSWSFTIVSTPVPSGSVGWGGGSVIIDHCPFGDTSGSYYDRQCWTDLVEKIVAKLTNDWADRSSEKVQWMLATLTLLNNKIQAIDAVSPSMKELFKNIVEALIAHYNQ
jgi:hypothetical protein